MGQNTIAGRALELDLWRAQVSEPEPKGLLILGEPGVGKTRLLAELAHMARKAGRWVATGVGREGTAGSALGAFAESMQPPPPTRPETLLWWASNRITAEAGTSPITLILDDAHLSDPLSVSLCIHMARRYSALVAIATRSTETRPVELEHLVSEDLAREIRLGPLDASEVIDMAADILGDRQLAPEAAERLVRLSGGLPLMVRELVRAGIEFGRIVRGPDGKWVLGETPAESPTLAGILEARIDNLNPTAKAAVDIITVAHEVPSDLLASACGWEALEELDRRGLTTTDPSGVVRCSHPLLAELAETHIPAPRLNKARTTLLGAIPEDTGASNEQLMGLLARIDLKAPRPDYTRQSEAARHAMELGDITAARTHAEAAALARVDASSLLVLAGIHLAAGDDRTEATLDALAAADLDETQQAEYAYLRSVHLARTIGDTDAAVGVLEAAMESTTDQHLLDRLLVQRTQAEHASLNPATLAERIEGILARDDLDPAVEVPARGFVAMSEAFAGNIENALAQEQHLLDDVHLSLPVFEAMVAIFGLGLAHTFAGDAARAQALARDALAQLCPIPGTVDEVGHRTLALEFELFRGHRHNATAWFDQALEADRRRSLHYGVLLRIHATWAGALSRDPRTSQVWSELRAAPSGARAAMATIEGIAEVAVVADSQGAGPAARKALANSTANPGTLSIETWLLHDAARHFAAAGDRPPAEITQRLGELAGNQRRRWIGDLFSANACALLEGAPGDLVISAADLRAGGFDMFAAEAEILAARRSAASEEDRARSLARAHLDLAHCGSPWSPLLADPPADPLTARQRQIALSAVPSVSNRALAEELGISVRTVENQLHRIYKTLGVHDRSELQSVLRPPGEPAGDDSRALT